MNKKAECIKIYCEAFGYDYKKFREKLFDNCFEYCYFLEDNGKVVSMLFALPCEILTKEKNYSAVYIFAAATLKEYRKKGYMSSLIEKIKCKNYDFVFLRPANKNLINFYENCGLKTITAIANEEGLPLAKPTANFSELADYYKIADNSSFAAMYFSKNNLKIENLHFIYSME